uniref:Uncharacterized protein n=1 Tax=Globodera rostochiensis TaxID=31243 RepID=A0A914H861_GLORO
MEKFWLLILVAFFVINSRDKAESVQLEELQLQTFDELFVDEWWDKDEAAEDLQRPPPTNFEQNVQHQIDRQNTQIGQIEPNSTDQNPPLTEILLSQSLITLDKLNPFQLIRILFSQSLITLDKLNPQLIRILLSQSLITLDKLIPFQLIRILFSQSLITLDKLNPFQLIRILFSQMNLAKPNQTINTPTANKMN